MFVGFRIRRLKLYKLRYRITQNNFRLYELLDSIIRGQTEFCLADVK